MGTRKLKAILSCLLSMCILWSGVLSGCGQPAVRSDEAVQIYDNYDAGGAVFENESASAEKITISGWLNPACVKNLMAFLAEEFPDYSFEYRYISKASYEYLLDSQLASKLASDIVMLSPTMAKKHAKNRYIEDVTVLCDDFNEKGRTTFMYGNRIYAVPCTSDYQCVFINKEILDQCGQKIPTSFTSFIELCDYVQSKLGIRPMSAGLKNTGAVADAAMAILGSGYFSTDEGKKFGPKVGYGRASFKDELRPYMSKWLELLHHNVYTRQMCILDDTAAIDEFASGNTLMYQGYLYDYNRIKEANPDIRLGTLALSTELSAKAVLIGGCNTGVGLNKYSENKDVAMKALRLIASEEGQRALWTDRQGSQTYLQNIKYDNPDEFDSIKPLANTNRVIMPWTEWGDHSSEIYSVFGSELQKVVLQQKTMDEALEDIDEETKKILREN